ncbi:transposase [Streptomyces sp. NPDC004546]|uniref:transposase n=1 Tax=Streptomyces sp. NPDC004546 TaxID=3154282 RepID=UPI0033ABDB65
MSVRVLWAGRWPAVDGHRLTGGSPPGIPPRRRQIRPKSPAASDARSLPRPLMWRSGSWPCYMIDEARTWGVDVPLVVADAGYGDATAFRLGLEERKLTYAVGISSRLTAHPGHAQPVTPAYQGIGRPPVATYPDKPTTVKELVMQAGRQAARPVSWREGSRPGKGRSGFKRMYSRFVALRIRPAGREIRQATKGAELPERWLLAEWPAIEPEPVQFWLSSLPSGMPLATLVRLAKLRWRIEHDDGVPLCGVADQG